MESSMWSPLRKGPFNKLVKFGNYCRTNSHVWIAFSFNNMPFLNCFLSANFYISASLSTAEYQKWCLHSVHIKPMHNTGLEIPWDLFKAFFLLPEHEKTSFWLFIFKQWWLAYTHLHFLVSPVAYDISVPSTVCLLQSDFLSLENTVANRI